MNKSLGALKFSGINKGIEFANEVLKKASVEIAYLQATCPGKFLFIASGNEDRLKSPFLKEKILLIEM